MAEARYLISETAKRVDVETHVLRYWEEELEIQIPRNEMGHRYYTDYHVRLFRQIKELKEKGYQLKAIKNAMNKMSGEKGIMSAEDYMEEEMKASWKESRKREKLAKELEEREKKIADKKEDTPGGNEINTNSEISDESENSPSGDDEIESAEHPRLLQTVGISNEKLAQFQIIMNHIIGQAVEANMEKVSREITEDISENVTDRVMKEVEYLMRVNDEKEEERFRQLDETIRAYQKNGKGRAEAAAAKIPLFKKRRFGKSGKKLF